MSLGLGGIVVFGFDVWDVHVVGTVRLVVEFGLPEPQVGALKVGIGNTVLLGKVHKVLNRVGNLYLF